MNMQAREKNRKVLNRSISSYTPEQISMFKMHEKVLCCGVEATIRDIYTRTFRYEDEAGNDQFGCFLSFRMHEPAWQALDIRFEQIEKLNGEISFQNKTMPKNIRIHDL